MRYLTLITTSLAALASASPNALSIRNAALVAANNEVVAQAIQFAALADGCSLISCASVIANVACIAAAIAAEAPTAGASTVAVIACVKEGLEKVCGCGACVPGLNDFLTGNNVCPK